MIPFVVSIFKPGVYQNDGNDPGKTKLIFPIGFLLTKHFSRHGLTWSLWPSTPGPVFDIIRQDGAEKMVLKKRPVCILDFRQGKIPQARIKSTGWIARSPVRVER